MALTIRGCINLDQGVFLGKAFRGRVYKRIPMEQRLASRVNFLGPIPSYAPHLGSCWLWEGSKDNHGYGKVWDASLEKLVKTHRAMYELVIGRIPDGLVIDHLCRVPACCNPTHLEPVSQYENMQRSLTPTMITQRSRVCKRGHKIEPLIECRKCANIKAKERYYANRDAILSRQKKNNSNPERKQKLAEYRKKYYQANKERLRRTPEQSKRANELKRLRRLHNKNLTQNGFGN